MPVEPNTIQPQGQSIVTIPVNVQMVYANNVTINITQSDIQIFFTANGRPAVATIMTLPVAKHLRDALDMALKNYESKTGIIIGDLTEIGEKLKK